MGTAGVFHGGMGTLEVIASPGVRDVGVWGQRGSSGGGGGFALGVIARDVETLGSSLGMWGHRVALLRTWGCKGFSLGVWEHGVSSWGTGDLGVITGDVGTLGVLVGCWVSSLGTWEH